MRNSYARLVVDRSGERESAPWQIETEVVRNDFVKYHPTTAYYSDKDQLEHKYVAHENQNMRLVAKTPGTSEAESDYKGQYRV